MCHIGLKEDVTEKALSAKHTLSRGSYSCTSILFFIGLTGIEERINLQVGIFLYSMNLRTHKFFLR